MTGEILSFPTSFLNPLLKGMVIILFAIGTVIFYQAYTSYGGNLKKISFFVAPSIIADSSKEYGIVSKKPFAI